MIYCKNIVKMLWHKTSSSQNFEVSKAYITPLIKRKKKLYEKKLLHQPKFKCFCFYIYNRYNLLKKKIFQLKNESSS